MAGYNARNSTNKPKVKRPTDIQVLRETFPFKWSVRQVFNDGFGGVNYGIFVDGKQIAEIWRDGGGWHIEKDGKTLNPGWSGSPTKFEAIWDILTTYQREHQAK